MKLKYDFEVMHLEDQIMAVPVGNNSEQLHGIVRLNGSAEAVFELLKQPTTVDKVVQTLSTKYDTSPETIRVFVQEFVDELAKKGLLE